jgi:diguanylate cyclase (GGDEF)-like protein
MGMSSDTIKLLDNITPHDLPSPPDVAIRIVRACGETEISAQDLQQIISRDTALVAELLRVVNSPFFGYRKRATKVEQALVILGQRKLRNVALLFIARETLRANSLSQLDVQGYWEDTLRRAVSARILAEAVGLDPDDAFTIGMLQDVGLLALFALYPHLASSWRELSHCNPEQRSRKELELFEISHDQVAKILMEHWGLPEEILLPLAHHHEEYLVDLNPEIIKACHLALCADWMASVYSAADKRLALVHCRRLMADTLGLDQRTSDDLLAQVPSAVQESAEALGIQVSQQVQFEEVLRNANRWLIEQHQDRDQLVQSLEAALDQREQLAEALQLACERLAQQAYHDPLTSLVNRRRFDEIFLGELGRHGRSAHFLSLMIMDIDGFKSINDNHGHQTGDSVLQAVAKAMKKTLRASDVAARIGGDEMCMLLPETNDEGGMRAAERVRSALQSLEVDIDPIQVTASIGGSTWHGRQVRGTEVERIHDSLVSMADSALYTSKKNGRDQVHWSRLS